MVGDGVDAELADKPAKFCCGACLLHSPDGLCEGVCPTPCSYVDGARVVLVGQLDEELTARRVVVLAYCLDASVHAAHNGATLQIVGTGPIAYVLGATFLAQREERMLAGALHEVGHIVAIGSEHLMQVLAPLWWIGVAVPAY